MLILKRVLTRFIFNISSLFHLIYIVGISYIQFQKTTPVAGLRFTASIFSVYSRVLNQCDAQVSGVSYWSPVTNSTDRLDRREGCLLCSLAHMSLNISFSALGDSAHMDRAEDGSYVTRFKVFMYSLFFVVHIGVLGRAYPPHEGIIIGMRGLASNCRFILIHEQKYICLGTFDWVPA